MATNRVIVSPVDTPSVSLSSPRVPGVVVNPIISGGGGKSQLTPTAEVVGSNVKFHYVTLDQMTKMHIASNAGAIGFTLTKGEYNFELRFSSDSPQEIAGNLIYDDSIDIVDDVFATIIVPLEGYAVDSVYLDGVDANLLEADINWRLADIQKRIGEANSAIDSLDEKISPYLYEPCTAEDIDHMFETVTDDGLIIIPDGLITPQGTMSIGVFKAITGLTPTE